MRGSQSLVPYGQSDTTRAQNTAYGLRTDARFLAHLIAVRSNNPEMRLKNRAAPEYGAAAYRRSNTVQPRAPARGQEFVA
jgi:hypothetical protein